MTVFFIFRNPCTDIVLWKPHGDFVKEIFGALASEDNLAPSVPSSRNQASFEHFYDTGMGDADMSDQQLNSFQSPVVNDDSFSDTALYQRRNARQYSKPIIEVLNLPTVR